MELDLNQLIKLIAKKFVLLLLVVFMFGAGAFCLSKFFMIPKYETKTTVLVSPIEQNDTTANFTLAQNYVSVFVEKITATDFLNKLSNNLFEQEVPIGQSSTEPYTVDQLNKMISAIKGNNYTFDIIVNTEDMDLSYQISKSIEDILQDQLLGNKINKIELDIIREAIPVNRPTSPNVALYTVIGLFLGAILGVLIIILIDKIDNTVKSGEDLTSKYKYPLLGSIYEHKYNESGERG